MMQRSCTHVPLPRKQVAPLANIQVYLLVAPLVMNSDLKHADVSTSIWSLCI
eukprot:COSAG01_NODE_4624_length_4867_cov_3.721686_2_plen_52_part_00